MGEQQRLTAQDKNIENGGNQTGPSEWPQTTMELLFRRQVILLAMKHGRAPMPVTPNLWNSLLRRGILKDLYELGNVARRFSFLGDGRMLLAELRYGPAKMPGDQETSSGESKTSAMDRSASRMHSNAYGIA
ncbi:MAG: hypothetical protein WBE13_19555 [Candidatus Acidiferrum sp.]